MNKERDTSRAIPKHLRHLLLQRGGMERIERELKARIRTVERPNLVYSTQQTAPRKREEDKNRGCCPTSVHLRTPDAFSTATSGRTKFWSLDNGTYLMGAPRVHVQGERRR